MSHSRTHPDDTTLILALDRELSVTRRSALDQHVTTCEPCRARLEAFEAAAQEAARICRDDAADDATATSALRRRLEERMTTVGSEWDRSLLFRLQRAASGVPRVARVVMVVALLGLAARLMQPELQLTMRPLASRYASLPIGRFTPGAVLNVSVQELCSGSVPIRRIVSMAVRQDVLQKYQMEHVTPSEYELDYLITPELGGAGEARNLWPQRYDSGAWNARVKDDLEQLLPRLVCAGTVELTAAQRDIAGNWIEAYKRYFKTDRPIPRQAGLVDADDDEIQFVATPRAIGTGSRVVSFARPPVVIPARLTTNDAFVTRRSRSVGW